MSNAQNILASGSKEYALASTRFHSRVTERFYDESIFYGGQSMGLVEIETLSGSSSTQDQMYGADEEARELFEGNLVTGNKSVADEYNITLRKNPVVLSYEHKKSRLEVSHFTDSFLAKEANSIGRGIARTVDKEAFQTVVNSARSPSLTKDGVTIHNGGHRVTRAVAAGASAVATAYPRSSAGLTNLLDDLAALNQQMDEDNLPQEGRYLFVTPYIYNIFTSYDNANGRAAAFFSNEFNRNTSNDFNKRQILTVENFNVMMVNDRIPSKNITSSFVSLAARGDFTQTGGGLPVATAIVADPMRPPIKIIETPSGLSTAFLDFSVERQRYLSLGTLHYGIGQAHPFTTGVIDVTAS